MTMFVNVPATFDHNHKEIVETYNFWREKLLACGVDEQFITFKASTEVLYKGQVHFRGTLDLVKWNEKFSLICYLKKITAERFEIIARNIEFKILENDDDGVYVAYSRCFLFAPIPPRVMRLCERIAKLIEATLQQFCYEMALDFKHPVWKAISDFKAERKKLRLHFHDKLLSQKEREALKEKTGVDSYLSSVDLIVPQNLWDMVLNKLAGSERRVLIPCSFEEYYRYSDELSIAHAHWDDLQWLEGDNTYESMKTLMRIVRETCPAYQYVRMGEDYDDFENELKGWTAGPLVVTRHTSLEEGWVTY